MPGVGNEPIPALLVSPNFWLSKLSRLGFLDVDAHYHRHSRLSREKGGQQNNSRGNQKSTRTKPIVSARSRRTVPPPGRICSSCLATQRVGNPVAWRL
jgi:hypothetical protein